MEVFDKDGNPVAGVLTQAEVDAKIAAEKAEWEKNKTPEPVTPPTNPNPEEPPAWAKDIISKVEKLSGNQTVMAVQDITSSLDAEKKAEFDKKFQSLTGYEDTPEGLQKRAHDAYLLATGQPYEATVVNVGQFTAVNGNPVRPSVPTTEVDKQIGEILGNTEEDIKKYGNK